MEKILRKLIIVFFIPLALWAEFVIKSYQGLKNERMIRQNYEESCGAASLATLLNLINDERLSGLDLLRVVSEKRLYMDMISFADLNEAVRKLGYESRAYKINKEILKKLISVPMLVKIEDDLCFPYFMVIINYRGDYLQVFDPSHGKYISSKREFYSVWDRHDKGGYALIIAPKKTLETFRLPLPNKINYEFDFAVFK